MKLSMGFLIKIALLVGLGFVIARISDLIIDLLIAGLISVTLAPAVAWLVSKKVPLGLARAMLSVLLIGVTVFMCVFLIPSVINQLSELASVFPRIKTQLEESFHSPAIRDYIHRFFENPQAVLGNVSGHLSRLGTATMDGIYKLVVTLVLSIYLLIDGASLYRWILVFFELPTQNKIHKTSERVQSVIFAYVAGQMLSSVLAGTYVFLICLFLKVPGSLMLACCAALFDVFPIIGFLSSLVITFLIALTVSAKTAGFVAIFYLVYHLLENYLILPKIYGTQMKLSKLGVLLSVLVGGSLAGIEGMILVLPIVASCPIIEKIWFRRYLRPGVVNEHQHLLGRDE